jgi:DUF2075 family protein
LSQSERIQKIEERGKKIHLPFVSKKVNILLIRGIRKLQMVCHGSFLETGNTEQVQKSYLEDPPPIRELF